jgi:DNA-binding GntR family transcriptional regulator
MMSTATGRASDQTIAKLKELISSGEFTAGARLPTERALTQRFGVSRSSLREAVRALALVGVLEPRVGDGTYVTSLEQAGLIAATQRPVAELAFSEPSGPPAWNDRPSWAVIATSDRAAGTDVVRSMAERAGAKITEVEGSHVIMVSQPDAVTEVILTAVSATSREPVVT